MDRILPGYHENVSFNLGENVYGYRTKVSLEGDQIITHKQYDAQPLLDRAQQIREQTEGTRWGEGQFVGTLPMHEAVRILAIRGDKERQKAIRAFFQENPMLCGNSKYLRTPMKA